jgi:hypothetical protein
MLDARPWKSHSHPLDDNISSVAQLAGERNSRLAIFLHGPVAPAFLFDTRQKNGQSAAQRKAGDRDREWLPREQVLRNSNNERKYDAGSHRYSLCETVPD